MKELFLSLVRLRGLITELNLGQGKAYRQFVLKRPELPDSFQGRVFKGNIWSEGCRVHDFLLIGWW